MMSLVLALALALLKVSAAQQQHPGVHKPPFLSVQPDKNVYFNPSGSDGLFLPCEANSSAPVTYAWTRNGHPFSADMNTTGVEQVPGVGTLHFSSPASTDVDLYQCWATSPYGVAVSHVVALREAMLGDFFPGPNRIHRPQIGRSWTLNCIPPRSIPHPHVTWVLVDSAGRSEPLHMDSRVTIDPEFRLRFVHVTAEDRQHGKGYACMTRNDALRTVKISSLNFLEPQGEAQTSPAQLMWSSPEYTLAMLGDVLVLKCIFSGNPTPTIRWERENGKSLPTSAQVRDSGRELVISTVRFSDAGQYTCHAENSVTSSSAATMRTITVRVDAHPYWVQEPGEVEGRVGGRAELHCDASGVPQPAFVWYINGVRLQDVTDPRIARVTRPAPDRLVISGLTSLDTMAVQCNATNRHGYVFGQFSLFVL